jgi:hypothetical protein
MSTPNIETTVQETIVLGPSFYAQEVVLEGDGVILPEDFGDVAYGTAVDAGALTGTETVPISRGYGFLQTTTSAIASLALVTPSEFGAAMLAWFNTLPTSLPATSGVLWNNGGTLAQS